MAHKRTKRCGKWRTNQWYPLEESKTFKFTASNCSACFWEPRCPPCPHRPTSTSPQTLSPRLSQNDCKPRERRCLAEFPRNTGHYLCPQAASLVAQTVKDLPATQETRLDPWVGIPRKEMTAHSSILAWRIPWTEEPGGATVHGSRRAGLGWASQKHIQLPLELETQGKWSLTASHS